MRLGMVRYGVPAHARGAHWCMLKRARLNQVGDVVRGGLRHGFVRKAVSKMEDVYGTSTLPTKIIAYLLLDHLASLRPCHEEVGLWL